MCVCVCVCACVCMLDSHTGLPVHEPVCSNACVRGLVYLCTQSCHECQIICQPQCKKKIKIPRNTCSQRAASFFISQRVNMPLEVKLHSPKAAKQHFPSQRTGSIKLLTGSQACQACHLCPPSYQPPPQGYKGRVTEMRRAEGRGEERRGREWR